VPPPPYRRFSLGYPLWHWLIRARTRAARAGTADLPATMMPRGTAGIGRPSGFRAATFRRLASVEIGMRDALRDISRRRIAANGKSPAGTDANRRQWLGELNEGLSKEGYHRRRRWAGIAKNLAGSLPRTAVNPLCKPRGLTPSWFGKTPYNLAFGALGRACNKTEEAKISSDHAVSVGATQHSPR
jgi:hypothetical protein